MYKILLLLMIIVVSGCSTLTVGTGEKTDVGVWQGKVQMTNKKNNNRKWAYVTWVSDSPHQRMRIDVRAIMDIPIATYMQKEDGAHLWLFTENKYFHSDDAEKLFAQLVKFSFDPDNFFSLLGNPRNLGDSWSCKNKGDLYTCFSPNEKANVSINHEDADKRIIKVDKGAKGLRMRLSRSKVRVSSRHFRKLSTTQFDIIEI